VRWLLEIQLSTSALAVGIAALILIVQMAFYYRRLPTKIAIHYDIYLEPGMYVHKAVYYVLIIGIATLTIWSFTTIVDPQERMNGAVILLFFFAVNQFIFGANREAKKLSPLIWVFVVLVLAYGGWVAYHRHT
jgi:uncharacterized membrane protein